MAKGKKKKAKIVNNSKPTQSPSKKSKKKAKGRKQTVPTCTVCGEDVELVAKCKECGAMFCDYCGDHDDKLCDFCFDEDTIDD